MGPHCQDMLWVGSSAWLQLNLSWAGTALMSQNKTRAYQPTHNISDSHTQDNLATTETASSTIYG